MHESSQVRLGALDVSEGHDPGCGGRRSNKHWIAVHEIADSRRDRVTSAIGFRRQMLFRQLEFRTKIGDFVGLRFEVVEIEIPQHEVEHCDAGTDVFEFVLAAIAEILSANLAVNSPREQMVSGAALGETIGTCVLGGLKFRPEERGSLAPARAGKT